MHRKFESGGRDHHLETLKKRKYAEVKNDILFTGNLRMGEKEKRKAINHITQSILHQSSKCI